MVTKVQARLDEEAQVALQRVMLRTGWNASKVVREGLRLLLEKHSGSAASRMIGIGMFASGVPDMGSNKKYLEGLGSNSGISKIASSRSKRKAS